MKTEEIGAMGVCGNLRILVKIFRFTEVFVGLAFFFWIFNRLPLAVRVSSDYISQISGFFSSSVFGFVLCNTIVVALIANPDRFSGQKLAGDSVETEIFNELVENGAGSSLSLPGNEPIGRLCSDPEKEEIVYEDKEVISEVSSAAALIENMDGSSPGLGCLMPENVGEKLRRLAVEEKEAIWGGGISVESVWYGEELSNKEFQERIEAFIARELRFRREESGAVVLRRGCLLL